MIETKISKDDLLRVIRVASDLMETIDDPENQHEPASYSDFYESMTKWFGGGDGGDGGGGGDGDGSTYEEDDDDDDDDNDKDGDE